MAPAASLTMTMVFLLIVFCFAWYLYIGEGSPFHSIVNVGVNTLNSLKDLFAVESREASALMAVGLARPEVVSLPRNVYLVLQYVIQVFIVAGAVGVTLKLIKSRFQRVFIAMALVSLVLLALCLILPRFSMKFNIGRIYHIAMMFLAPFCVIGGAEILRWIHRLAGRRSSRPVGSAGFAGIVGVMIVVPYFLFSTGFVYAVSGDKVTSIALNQDLDTPRYNRMEISARNWLDIDMADHHPVYADEYGRAWLVDPRYRAGIFWGDTDALPDGAYIFLRTINVRRGLVAAANEGQRSYVSLKDSAFGREVLSRSSRIYDNGGACFYDTGPGGGP
jgi:uncharacterized membrane protein